MFRFCHRLVISCEDGGTGRGGSVLTKIPGMNRAAIDLAGRRPRYLYPSATFYTHTHTHIHTHIIYIYIYIYVYTYIYIYIYMYIYVYIFVYRKLWYMHQDVRSMADRGKIKVATKTDTQTDTHTHTHTHKHMRIVIATTLDTQNHSSFHCSFLGTPKKC